jgi:hypothetical protein
MPFSPETQEIIAEVEQLSGRPVHVEEDPSLQTLATVATARGKAPAHFVRYKQADQTVDYLIAFQLGFVVRLFSCPAEERFDVVASNAERHLAFEKLGLGEFSKDIAGFLADSLITQLCTYSVGMRVDKWIADEYPTLQDGQQQSAGQQLRQNESALSPELRGKFPKPVVDANTAMNAAYAFYWAAKLNEPRLKVPFSVIGADIKGLRLLEILNQAGTDPRDDRKLIEGWADELGLTSCFHFEPHVLS